MHIWTSMALDIAVGMLCYKMGALPSSKSSYASEAAMHQQMWLQKSTMWVQMIITPSYIFTNIFLLECSIAFHKVQKNTH